MDLIEIEIRIRTTLFAKKCSLLQIALLSHIGFFCIVKQHLHLQMFLLPKTFKQTTPIKVDNDTVRAHILCG